MYPAHQSFSQSFHFLLGGWFYYRLMVVMNSENRNNKSLYENSMKMVANIIKLSSFSIAQMSLGAAGPSPPAKTLQSTTSSVMVADKPLLPQSFGSKRSEKSNTSPQPISFLMEPNGRDESQYVVHGENSPSPIDGKASAYIRKVHQKNLSDLSESSNLPPLPPPPRLFM